MCTYIGPPSNLLIRVEGLGLEGDNYPNRSNKISDNEYDDDVIVAQSYSTNMRK